MSLDIETINLPRIGDPRGNLSFIQRGDACPFDIGRVYWIYDVPSGRVRHGRALRRTTEMIVALSGSFTVHLADGAGNSRDITLTRSDLGVVVPPMTWRSIERFATNSVAMVLASGPYDPDEYIDDYETYEQYVNRVG